MKKRNVSVMLAAAAAEGGFSGGKLCSCRMQRYRNEDRDHNSSSGD